MRAAEGQRQPSVHHSWLPLLRAKGRHDLHKSTAARIIAQNLTFAVSRPYTLGAGETAIHGMSEASVPDSPGPLTG